MTAGRSPDVTDWDAFVEQAEQGSYLQLSPWAAVKAVNGWQAFHIASGDEHHPSIGAQVLVRRPRPLPWAFAYAPRGPVTQTWSAETIQAFTDDARRGLARSAGRVSHLRIDPEIEADGVRDPDGSLRDGLRAAGWRSAPPIQPTSTRVIDLTEPEEALWSGLRKKWRQYVNKARTGGVTVVDGGAGDLATFYRIYRETADRAGFLIRTESAYRDVWQAFAPTGRARLLLANSADGEPVAALLLIRCGTRVVEPYGGMTQAGAKSRANYLLKWEAIRSSREQGAGIYDLWGLAHPGIAHFKTGFGGREVRYIGAWDLVLDPLGRQVYGTAQAARVWWARRGRGLRAAGSAAEFGGGEAG